MPVFFENLVNSPLSANRIVEKLIKKVIAPSEGTIEATRGTEESVTPILPFVISCKLRQL